MRFQICLSSGWQRIHRSHHVLQELVLSNHVRDLVGDSCPFRLALALGFANPYQLQPVSQSNVSHLQMRQFVELLQEPRFCILELLNSPKTDTPIRKVKHVIGGLLNSTCLGPRGKAETLKKTRGTKTPGRKCSGSSSLELQWNPHLNSHGPRMRGRGTGQGSFLGSLS